MTFFGLKQVILEQTRQNRYQTVPFDVYIINLTRICFHFGSENSLGMVVILPYIYVTALISDIFWPETSNT